MHRPENLDWIGLEMAARSFAKKRQSKRRPSWYATFKLRLSRLRFFSSSNSGFVSCGNLKCENSFLLNNP